MNLSVNGPTHSENGQKSGAISRHPIAAVAAIATTLARAMIDHPEGREILLWSAWRIACAWEAVLAGDIDDILEHCALEESALRSS
jgi:hypothetical protein